MNGALERIKEQTIQNITELIEMAKLAPGQIVVVGCSTSEVIGAHIGSAGSKEVAKVILDGLRQGCAQYWVYLAVQCC